MAEVTVRRSGTFDVLSNYHLKTDRSLSYKAKGLLTQMLSFPDDWDYSVSGLAALTADGLTSVRAGLDELEAAGYLRRVQTRNEKGFFGKAQFIVYETPSLCQADSLAPYAAYPYTENPHTDKPTTDNPQTDKPTTDKPMADKHTQYNTQESNTKEYTPIAPKGARRRADKTEPDWKPDRFARFWLYYPRGEAKQSALRAWDKLKPDEALLAQMAQSLERQMQREDWQRGVGIPYASTWLNQKRWQDETKLLPTAQGESRGFIETEEVTQW